MIDINNKTNNPYRTNDNVVISMPENLEPYRHLLVDFSTTIMNVLAKINAEADKLMKSSKTTDNEVTLAHGILGVQSYDRQAA